MIATDIPLGLWIVLGVLFALGMAASSGGAESVWRGDEEGR